MRAIKILEYRNGRIVGYTGVPDPGLQYLLKVDVSSAVDYGRFKAFVNEFSRRVPWMRIIYGTVKGNSIYLYMEPCGFRAYQESLAFVMSILPEILGIVGLGLVGASLYIAISSMPSWAKIMAFIGFMLMLVPLIFGAVSVRPPKVEYKGKVKEYIERGIEKYKEKYW